MLYHYYYYYYAVQDGYTALDYASRFGQVDIVQLLLQNGADVTTTVADVSDMFTTSVL